MIRDVVVAIIGSVLLMACNRHQVAGPMRVVTIGEGYGICASAPEAAVQTNQRKGLDAHGGRITWRSSVDYEIGWGLQGEPGGTRTNLPTLSHGQSSVYLWEDSQMSAIVVEGLKTKRLGGEARAHVWYLFSKQDQRSRELAEQLARTTDYCKTSSAPEPTSGA